MVQREQIIVSFEGVKVAGTPAKPARRRVVMRCFAIAGEVGTDVVEHAVQKHSQASPMRFGDEVVEIVVVAEPRIDPVMIGGVVTVCARSEDRPERDTRRTELNGVIEPISDPPQPVFTRFRGCGRRESTDEAEGVDMPPDHMPYPGRYRHRRYLAS